LAFANRQPPTAIRHPPSANRLLRTLILAAVLTAACGTPSTAPVFGENVTVQYNAAVHIPSDTTTVRFIGVTAGSRCPFGAQCIWTGDAAVTFVVGGTQQVTLHTNAGTSTVILAGRRLTLVSLSPYPNVSTPIALQDYVATIRFDTAND
jgi:hypothetical protein